ncbi:DMT family transporter [Tumebacillus permanentifrigoris]|uniref:Drug/metabolite transporter (DMT)-like permease n=1 Tax=Tumebacillus permanentifrigoris TaxID=378543 RepID=A0A316D966_9BACL|nr:DMT family transporter [Tumebacillus permanentifrigoris]PWK11360.1 drug/metabolite transporter (DMT)-like permease [Tumebacillus permanentifrigoris]
MSKVGSAGSLQRSKGFAMVLAAGTFWGLSGTVAQKLFQEEGFTTEWLVVVRMLTAGVLLLGLSAFGAGREQVLGVWKDSGMRVRLIVYGVFGILGAQYTYFAAIEAGNAAAATLLQYLAPLFVMVFQAWRVSRMPDGRECTAVVTALVGTFLLVTNGSVHDLSIPTQALLWGLVSALGLAFNTIYPGPLLRAWDSSVILGWGLVIGGVAVALADRPWNASGMHWSWVSVSYVAFVILFGTLIAFYLYLDSLRYITVTETSLLAIIEPLVSVLASVLWLKVPLGFWEAVGAACILITVTILSLPAKRVENEAC